MIYKELFKVNLLLACSCFILTKTKAQVISPEICKQFSPSIVSKLFDIAKNTALDETQLYKLAKQLQLSDSILVQAIQSGKDVQFIDSLKSMGNIKMLMLLDNKQRASYAEKEADNFADLVGKGEFVAMQEAYKPDPTTSKFMKSMVLHKYKNLYQLYQQNQYNKGTLQISSVAKFYDSLTFSIYPSLYSEKYVDNYLKKIKSVKPDISDTVLVKIKNLYRTNKNKNSYTDLAQALMTATQMALPDTSVFSHLYKNELLRQSVALSSADRYNLVYLRHVSKGAYDSISHLIIQKNYQQALVEYTYAFNLKLQDSIMKKTTSYYDSTIEASLLRDGSLLSSSQFAIALKYKKYLELRPTLTDTLLRHAMFLQQKHDSILLRDPYAKSDSKVYEASYMNDLLTEDQYTKLLVIKNKSEAKMDAENDWADMENRGIAGDFDKENTIKQLYQYYLAKWNAYYRNANDKIKQEANLRTLKDDQPKALKMLAAAKKLNAPVNSNAKLKMQW